jgi:hypothetical protein
VRNVESTDLRHPDSLADFEMNLEARSPSSQEKRKRTFFVSWIPDFKSESVKILGGP